ncbi:MAG: hypothetical protein ACLQBD_10130 [Syntrophobacteraceae bacterium]
MTGFLPVIFIFVQVQRKVPHSCDIALRGFAGFMNPNALYHA